MLIYLLELCLDFWSSIPGSGRSLGEGNGSLLWYSCLENLINRGAWWATVHEVSKIQIGLLTHANLAWIHAHYWFPVWFLGDLLILMNFSFLFYKKAENVYLTRVLWNLEITVFIHTCIHTYMHVGLAVSNRPSLLVSSFRTSFSSAHIQSTFP